MLSKLNKEIHDCLLFERFQDDKMSVWNQVFSYSKMKVHCSSILEFSIHSLLDFNKSHYIYTLAQIFICFYHQHFKLNLF